MAWDPGKNGSEMNVSFCLLSGPQVNTILLDCLMYEDDRLFEKAIAALSRDFGQRQKPTFARDWISNDANLCLLLEEGTHARVCAHDASKTAPDSSLKRRSILFVTFQTRIHPRTHARTIPDLRPAPQAAGRDRRRDHGPPSQPTCLRQRGHPAGL